MYGHEAQTTDQCQMNAMYELQCNVQEQQVKVKVKVLYSIAVNGSILWHSYGVSLATWDHTVSPATRHK